MGTKRELASQEMMRRLGLQHCLLVRLSFHCILNVTAGLPVLQRLEISCISLFSGIQVINLHLVTSVCPVLCKVKDFSTMFI